jgi:hypothetical protein
MNMKRLVILIVVGLLIGPVVKISSAADIAKPAAGPTNAGPTNAGPTKENALEAAKELAQAMLTNDADAYCRLLDPDWAIVSGFGDIGEDHVMGDGTEKEKLCAAIKAGTFTRKTYDMDFANARVRVYGNMATVTAKLSVSGPSGHNNPPGLEKWSAEEVQTDVLKWEDGAWKDVLTHETDVKDTLRIEKAPAK